MFYALKNLTSATVFKVPEPWKWINKADYTKSKDAFMEWCKNPGTDHMFFSAFEGLDPALRVTNVTEGGLGGNPPYKMYAFIVDYDGRFNGQPDIDKILANPPTEYMPAYVCATKSGNCRAIWMLESELPLTTNGQATKAFLDLIGKKIKANRWFAGFDQEASKAVNKYYEAGTNWIPVKPKAVIPSVLLHTWMYEAYKGLSFADWDRTSVTLEKVHAAIEERWPGVWQGPFEEGRRIHRFWDPSAKNETAAQLHRDGFACYTGTQENGFISWRTLLGTEWIDLAQSDVTGKIRENTYYCSLEEKFYVKAGERWVRTSKSDFAQKMRVKYRLSGRVGQGDVSSPIDKVEDDIKENRAIEGARPFLFEPRGVVFMGSDRILNTSMARTVDPALPASCPDMVGDFDLDRKYYPFLYELFCSFFRGEGRYEDQLFWLLCWQKHFYENARLFAPAPGQAAFLAGIEGKGKSLYGQEILGYSMGGHADASNYLVHDSPWNDDLVDKPVMMLDDSSPNDDHKAHARFGTAVKKAVANPHMSFNGKWKSNGQIRWNGRILVLLNHDVLSQQILPSMEQSNLTKISMLRTCDKVNMVFPTSREEIRQRIRAEMPYFLAMLLKLKVPEKFINYRDTRFFLIPYHHPELFQASVQQGASQPILELLQMWMGNYRMQHPKAEAWKGTASELFQIMLATPNISALMPKNGVRSLTNALGILSARGYPIYKLEPNSEGLVNWAISTVLKQIEKGTVDPLKQALDSMKGPVLAPKAQAIVDVYDAPLSRLGVEMDGGKHEIDKKE